jgi:putative ABC transport system permease protein
MFDVDKWLEIFHTIITNPLRTVLTGVSVALGIFILVVMQGLGFGLQNGVYQNMQDDAINSLYIHSWATSLPYKGLNAGREITYKNDDLQHVVDKYDEVTTYSGRMGMWGVAMEYGSETQNFSLRGVHPGHLELERSIVTGGRFINAGDVADARKITVLGKTIVEDLFRGKDPIGEYVKINGVLFRVVGTFEDPGSKWENRNAYVPITTAQRVYGRNDQIDMFMVTTGEMSLTESIEMAAEIDAYLKEKHVVHPDDKRAITVNNNNESFAEMVNVFTGIRTFIWAVGIFTLLAGIIGVANIMSIIVKERTKEIGVRKALGATPASVLGLIIQEAVFLTTIAGSIGLVAGVVLLEVLAMFIDHEFFTNPTINFGVCLGALILLIIAGALSGLLPAIRAVRIRPVEALRDE